MPTTAELITQIETILANGTESVSIADRRLQYRSVNDLQQILNSLKRKESGSTGWKVTYLKQGAE